MSKITVFLIILATGLTVYFPSFDNIQRRDHYDFVVERKSFNNDFKWFLFAMSHSRSRHTGRGDYFLFRPGTHSFLALEEITLGKHLIAYNVLSVILAVILSFLLFQIFSLAVPQIFALLLSLLILTNPAGCEMIIWRHISPYLLAMIFSLFAILNIQTFWKSFRYFLAASFFHEVIIFNGFVLVGLQTLSKFLKKQNDALQKYSKVLSLVMIVYFSLSILEAIVYNLRKLFGPSDVKHGNFFDALSYFSYFFTTSVKAIFLPFLYQLRMGQSGILELQQTPLPFWGNALIGLLGVFLVVQALLLIKKLKDEKKYLLIWFLVSLFSLCFGVGIGRGYLRGYSYLNEAPYYFYFTNICWLLIVSFLISKKITSKNTRTISYACVTISLIYQCITTFLVISTEIK